MGSFEEDKDIIERNLERVTERPIVQYSGSRGRQSLSTPKRVLK